MYNFWEKMIQESIASGILPVVVLGPTKVAPAQQDDCDRMWEELDQLLQSRYATIPVIDLRVVGRAEFSRFGPGQAQLAATLLAESVIELQARLQALRDAAQRR